MEVNNVLKSIDENDCKIYEDNLNFLKNNTREPSNSYEFFIVNYGILQKHKESLGENYLKNFEELQSLYDGLYKRKSKRCNCDKDEICTTRKKLSVCRNLKKYSWHLHTIKYFLGTNDNIYITTEFSDIFSAPAKFIKCLLELTGNTSGKEEKAKVVLIIGEVIMKSKKFIQEQQRFRNTLTNKFQNFMQDDKEVFDELSEKLGLSENIMQLWLNKIAEL